jgi:synaptobrevin family protein YKT6
VGAVIIADEEYPQMTAHHIISRLLDEFITKHPKSSWPTKGADNQMKFPELSTYLQQYQNPENADSLIKIQKELDETKAILHKTINATLDRGEQLADLAEKSGRLSTNAEFLFKQAKSKNSCW